jgi:hypothetical protein
MVLNPLPIAPLVLKFGIHLGKTGDEGSEFCIFGVNYVLPTSFYKPGFETSVFVK